MALAGEPSASLSFPFLWLWLWNEVCADYSQATARALRSSPPPRGLLPVPSYGLLIKTPDLGWKEGTLATVAQVSLAGSSRGQAHPTSPRTALVLLREESQGLGEGPILPSEASRKLSVPAERGSGSHRDSCWHTCLCSPCGAGGGSDPLKPPSHRFPICL